jgi:hypothetical protein
MDVTSPFEDATFFKVYPLYIPVPDVELVSVQIWVSLVSSALTTILLEKEASLPIKLTPEVDTMAKAIIEATAALTMRLLSINIPP